MNSQRPNLNESTGLTCLKMCANLRIASGSSISSSISKQLHTFYVSDDALARLESFKRIARFVRAANYNPTTMSWPKRKQSLNIFPFLSPCRVGF